MQTIALIIVLQVMVTLMTGCSQFEAKIEEMNTTIQNDGLQQ